MGFLSTKLSCIKPTSISIFPSEALEFYRRSWRLIPLPIFLLSPILSTSIFISNYLAASPLLSDISINLFVLRIASGDFADLLASDVISGARSLAAVELAFAAAHFVSSSFLCMTTIHFAGAGAPADLLSRIRRSWSAALWTQFLVFIFNLSFVFLSAIFLCCLFYIVVFVAKGATFIAAAGAFAAALPLLWLYVQLSMAAAMGIVISVLEQGGCSGVEALVMGIQLARRKRKVGEALAAAMSAAGAGFAGACAFSTALVLPLTPWPVANGVVSVAASAVAGTATMAAFTVFYLDCRGGGAGAGDGEDEEEGGEEQQEILGWKRGLGGGGSNESHRASPRKGWEREREREGGVC